MGIVTESRCGLGIENPRIVGFDQTRASVDGAGALLPRKASAKHRVRHQKDLGAILLCKLLPRLAAHTFVTLKWLQAVEATPFHRMSRECSVYSEDPNLGKF
jgi:hypothetical protein